MKRTQRHLAGILIILVAGILGMAGCVSVPTSGPIEKVVEGQQPTCQNCVNVEVAPPGRCGAPRDCRGLPPGDLQLSAELHRGQAVSDSDGCREVEPREGSLDLSRFIACDRASQGQSLRSARRLLGEDRTYTAEDQTLSQNFDLKKENGEWRINTLPGGLWIDEFYFARFYQTYDLYFVSSRPRWFPTRSIFPCCATLQTPHLP